MIIKSLPKFLLAAFVLFLSENLFAQTESEPNNTRATANTLALNGSKSGALNIAGDVDWYKVTTTADGQLNITFNNTGNQDIKNVSLYDNDGVTVLNSSGIGNGVGGFNTDGLAAGTYYIEISGRIGNETGAYTLSDALTMPAKANDNEPNGTVMQALNLNLNGSATGHLGYYYNHQRDTTDWYKVTINFDGHLYIMLDNSGNNDLKTLNLFDTAGSPLLTGGNIGNGLGGIEYDGLAAGTYYIQLTGGANGNYNDFGPYTLSDSLARASKPNDKESNDIISKAERLLLNNSTTGHLGYYYNHQRDTTDWYKVTTNFDGHLYIILDNSGNNDLKTLNLFDTTGSLLLTGGNIGNGLGGIEYDGLASGTYYIQLTGGANGSFNDFGPYTLSDSLAPASKPNDIEPNNNFSQAKMLTLNDSVTGHYGYYYYSKRDTSDWYKINIVNRGKLKLTFDNTGNVDLETLNLYDASGSTVIQSSNVGDGVGGIETDTLSPGTYYIQITAGAGGNYNNFGPYSLTDTLYSALPVTFISFNGKLNNDETVLTWSTTSELNNKGFEVQKSYDGKTFNNIGFVNGHSYSTQINNYTYTDVKVASGSNYYRLKQIDNDGKFTYSAVIKLNYSAFNWLVLGNLAANNSWVELQLDKAANISVQLISISGKIMQTINKGTLAAGTYSIPLNVNNITAGIYVVNLIVDNQHYSKKVMK